MYGNYGVSNEYLTRDKEKPLKQRLFIFGLIYEPITKTVLEDDFLDLRIL